MSLNVFPLRDLLTGVKQLFVGVKGKAPNGESQDIKVTTEGKVVTHNDMEYYGATVSNRPAANSVPVGAIYMAVDSQETWQSNGTQWKVV